MQAHVIENNIVVNTIEIESLDIFPDWNLIDASLGGAIGDTYNEETKEFLSNSNQALIVPATVTRRQARQALLMRGLLDYVPAALATIEDPLQRGLATIEWEDATEFERNRPLVIQIGQALELDEEGLDELFIFAATL